MENVKRWLGLVRRWLGGPDLLYSELLRYHWDRGRPGTLEPMGAMMFRLKHDPITIDHIAAVIVSLGEPRARQRLLRSYARELWQAVDGRQQGSV